MALAPAFLDELRARTLLSALVGKSVKLQRAGREWRACCPFHDEKSASFYINDEKGFGHCFGCSWHGDAIRWLTDQRGLSFIDAVKELAHAAGMEMPAQDRQSVAKAARAKALHEAMADATAWFADRLAGIEGAAAREVLDRRGIKPETARSFGLGFSPDSRGKLKDALKSYGDRVLVEAGLLIQVENKEPYDRFRGRLMIPIADTRGSVIAFGGRAIGAAEPKYLNSPDTRLFDKGRTLYNLDRAAAASRKAGRVIAVEGYMDVIALAQAGIAEVVAPLGTALTEHQLERLWRMAEVPLLCFDGDGAGQKAAIRAARRALPLLQPGRSLAFVTLSDGLDPDDLVRTRGAAAFEALVRTPEQLVDRIWAHELAAEPVATPEARAGLKRRLLELANTIVDRNVRAEYLAEFRRRFDERFGQIARRSRAPAAQVVGAAVRSVRASGIDPILARAVLAGLIRHPAEVARHMEVLGSLRSASDALGKLFEAVIELAIEGKQIDGPIVEARAGERLGPAGLPFSFTRDGADELQAREDLGDAIAVMMERPAVDRAIADATEQLAQAGTEQAFAHQVALSRRRGELDARLYRMVEA